MLGLYYPILFIPLSALICTLIGSGILHLAFAHTTYNIVDSAEFSAIGSGVIWVPWFLLAGVLDLYYSELCEDGWMAYFWFVIGALNAPAASALGAKLLGGLAVKGRKRQSVAQSAAAAGVGAAVWLRATHALVLILGSAYGLNHAVQKILKQRRQRRARTGGEGQTIVAGGVSHELGDRRHGEQQEIHAPMI